MKTVSPLCLLAVIGVLLTGSELFAQGSGQPATKENLDLPYDAFGLSEEEEEAPEAEEGEEPEVIKKGKEGEEGQEAADDKKESS